MSGSQKQTSQKPESPTSDGYLYVTANQLHCQPKYQEGKDLRRKPYTLFRIKIHAKPVLLRMRNTQ